MVKEEKAGAVFDKVTDVADSLAHRLPPLGRVIDTPIDDRPPFSHRRTSRLVYAKGRKAITKIDIKRPNHDSSSLRGEFIWENRPPLFPDKL